MALSLVSEDSDFADVQIDPLHRQREWVSQDVRGAAPQAPSYQRATSPRLAAPNFPTEQVIAVLSAIGVILGARAALFLAGLGVYLLGMQAADGSSIWPMVTFAAFVVLPLMWLSSQRAL